MTKQKAFEIMVGFTKFTNPALQYSERKDICESAPFPKCNGADGCYTCEHQKEE